MKYDTIVEGGVYGVLPDIGMRFAVWSLKCGAKARHLHTVLNLLRWTQEGSVASFRGRVSCRRVSAVVTISAQNMLHVCYCTFWRVDSGRSGPESAAVLLVDKRPNIQCDGMQRQADRS